jgi:acid phosphatase
MRNWPGITGVSVSAVALFALSACSSVGTSTDVQTTLALQSKVKNIVVIYAENRGFDNLYGHFPGANGIPSDAAAVRQTDRDPANTVLATLPQTWGGFTASGQTPVVTQAQSAGLPNAPFQIETAFQSSVGVTLTQGVITRDMYHRFFENQMQINGGKNDKFVAYADAGGIVMGYYDGSSMALYKLAQQYVLADNFFQGAFGGSFLNHQYLVCACAPEYPNADTAAAKPTITRLDLDSKGNFTHNLTIAATSKPSAMDAAPAFALSGNLTPKNYFGDGTFRAVNTMQPPYQPSGNAPAATDATKRYADPKGATTLPPQTQTTIGDLLSAKSIAWVWYSGAWNSTLAAATTDRKFPPSSVPGSAPNFQFHHQPFNYFQNLDPVSHAADRAAHLKDYDDLVADVAAGTLPPVVFYKPEGDLNQHPGYASVAAGDQHIADLLAKLQASPQWNNMVVVITYDENGGTWDHVAPPSGDLVGPGTRIPAIIVSPFAKMGTVDHTQYDTASVLRLITRRFGLDTLPGIKARDDALKANGAPAMGDLTNALSL